MNEKIKGLFIEIIRYTTELSQQVAEILERRIEEGRGLSREELDIVLEEAQRLEDFMNLVDKISEAKKHLTPKYEALTEELKKIVRNHTGIHE